MWAMDNLYNTQTIASVREYFFDEIFIQSYYIKLRFKKDIKFLFYHGSKIYGLISKILDLHPTEKNQKNINDIVIYPCETGRIYYKTGNEYSFSITFLKDGYDFENKIKFYFSSNIDKGFSNDLLNSTVELVEVSELKHTFEIGQNHSSNIHTIKFLTPLRIVRKKEDQVKGGAFFDSGYFNFQRFLYFLYKRAEAIFKINFGGTANFEIPPFPSAEIIDKSFIWIEMPKNDQKRNTGGIVGSIKFKCQLNDFWHRLIYFGQFIHVGKSTSAGFGKYIFDDNNFDLLTKPAATFLDRILEKENLISAFEHIKENSGFAGVDGISPDVFELNLESNLNSLINSVKSNTYKPENLQGIIIPKSETKIRALAIPTVKDRVLQRAVSQILSISIDEMLEDNSFAYRKGYSRSSAAYVINKARNEGYNFILESDIQSFFDNVNWDILIKKLEILYGGDPVLPLLIDWVKSDVVYNNQIIKRTKGLPQGCVISPLLANLYLDEFDEALEDEFKLVRYADDFVILCKSKEQAEQALMRVKETLYNLELDINLSKTNVISFQDGFQYLGYLFVNSLIIDKSANDKGGPQQKYEVEINREAIPNGSWLTLVDFKNIHSAKKEITTKIKPLNNNEVQEILLEKYPLYITNFSSIFIENDNIEILTEEEDSEMVKTKYPISQLSSVVVIGYSKITMPAVFKLYEYGIPIFFCKPNGDIRMQINPQTADFDLWLQQAEFGKDENFRLEFAKEIVQAKINNQKVTSRRTNDDENIVDKFNNWIEKISSAGSVDSLRGIEGSAAVYYFDILNNSLPDEWKFDLRTKHPPLDPFNSMLSFGYSLFYHHISTALIVEGLNPQIGLFHSPSVRYYPLAADIQEEFRHIIDGLTLYIIRRNMVSLNDFIINENSTYPCAMTKEFRKKYVSMIEERLKTEFTPPGHSKKITYKQFIGFQVKTLKTSIKEKKMCYKSLKIR